MKKRKKKISSLRWMVRGMFLWMIISITIPIILFTDSCSYISEKSNNKYFKSINNHINNKHKQ